MTLKLFAPVAALCAAAGTATTAHAQWVPDYQNYTIQRIGLFGAAQTGSAGLQSSTAVLFNAPGFVSGSSNRYTGVNTDNGQNTWACNSGTNMTVQTGLTGAAWTGSAAYQFSESLFQNAAGQVAGRSNRITGVNTANGTSTWVYNPATNTTVQTGLTASANTGSAGFQFSESLFQSASGHVAGYSQRITGVNTVTGRNTWVYNPATNTTVQTGLTGAAWTGSAGYQVSESAFLSAAGQVAGRSDRITGVSTFNGRNSWAYNPVTNAIVQTGMTGAAYTGIAGYQVSESRFQNAAGQVAGRSYRIAGVNTVDGSSTWIYNPVTSATVQIGLTGPGYTGTAGYQDSFTYSQNAAGQVAGTSKRVTDVNTTNGSNTWVYNPATSATVQTGLTGAAWTGSAGYQEGFYNLQNAAGQVAGYSQRVIGVNTDNGRNTWVYNPATNMTVQTGLTGAAWTGSAGYQNTNNGLQNAAGQIAGYSDRITGVNTINGTNTWVYNPATNTTVQTGLNGPANTGSAGFQNGISEFQNDAGQIAGYSNRYTGVSTPNGQNTWVYNPVTGTVVQTGLTSAAHTGSAGYQYSVNDFQNAAGQVAGYSNRTTGVITFVGRNAWVYNPATNTTVQTGLTGPAYSGSAGYQYSFNNFQNAAGQVAGYSQRVTGVNTQNGQDTFYFDPTTQVSSAIIGSVRTSDNYAFSSPTILTDAGFLLGNYLFFPGGVGAGEQRAFIFRPDLGFTDLGNLVSGGLTASGWSTLQRPQFSDALRTIVGFGYVNGQTTGQSVFVMKAGAARCGLSDIAGPGQAIGPDGQLTADDIIVYLNWFFAGNANADIAGPGQSTTPDSQFTADDIIVFLNRFFAGC